MADLILQELKDIDNILKSDTFQNITVEEAALMLGYFTQKLQQQGFPWEIRKQKGFSRVLISEIAAIKRLQNSERIYLRPKRIMKVNIASDATSISKLGSQLGKTINTTKIQGLGSSLNVQEGFEVRFGNDVPIENFAQLKLFYIINNPDAKINTDAKYEKLAKIFSFFASKKLTSNYPFKFYMPARSFFTTIKEGFLSGITSGLGSSILGAFISALLAFVAKSLGIKFDVSKFILFSAIVFGLFAALQQIYQAFGRGESIDEYTAFARLIKEEIIIIQEKKKHSFNIPIIGNVSWYTDYGKGSYITSIKEFELFYKMQNQ